MKAIRNYRAIQILDLLRNNGPLSFRTLLRLMRPSISEKKLRLALNRLILKGYILRKYERIAGGHGTYYKISHKRSDLEKVSAFLDMPIEQIVHPYFYHRNILHNEDCAVWMDTIKRNIPDAMYVRDFEFSRNPLTKKIMSLDPKDSELNPDFIYILESKDRNRPTSVAVEIEKSRKSNQRLLKKLYKYSNATHVDGVLYIYDTDCIADTIQNLFVEKILPRARRIDHYPKNFFMYLKNVDKHQVGNVFVYNMNHKMISLAEWTYYLHKTSFNHRRDLAIETMGESTPPQSKESSFC